MKQRIIKNQPVRLEFGDYGNFATLIPTKLVITKPNYHIVRMSYGRNDIRTIDLCFSLEEVDTASFKGGEI